MQKTVSNEHQNQLKFRSVTPTFLVILNILQWLAAFALFSLAVFCFRRRQQPAAKAVGAFAFFTGWWALCAALVAIFPDLETKILINRLRMITPGLIPLCLFWVSIVLQRNLRFPTWFWASLAIIPVTSSFITISPFHHWLITNYRIIDHGGYSVLAFDNGPWFAVHFSYGHLMMIITGVSILVLASGLGGFHRRKKIILLAAIFLPAAIDMIAVLNFEILRYVQIVPAALVITAGAMTYIVLKQQLLSVIPFARSFILDHSTDGYLAFDNFGRLVDFNQTSRYLFELKDGDVGEDLTHLKLKYPALNDSSQSPIKRDEKVFELTELPLKDKYQENVGKLMVIKDVTSQQIVAENLKEVSQLKTQLLGVLGHDLQGNLASLSLAAENLMKESTFSPEDVRAQAEDIYHNTRFCMSFVEQLLSWSKSQMGVFDVVKEQVHPVDLIEEVLLFLRPITSQKEIEVEVLKSENVRPFQSDRNMLRIVLRNLLSNAIKFSPPSSRVLVHVLQDTNRLEICVEDFGDGISKDQLSRILNQSLSHKSGFGLIVSQDFIRKLGGHLEATSTLGEGSRFSIVLTKG